MEDNLRILAIPQIDGEKLFLGLSGELEKSESLFNLLNKVIDTFYPLHPWAKLSLISRQKIFFDRGSASQEQMCSEALDLMLKSIKMLWDYERAFHQIRKPSK